MLGEAFSIYRKHFGALVLTAAIALLPANLLMAGAVVFGLAGLGASGVAETQTRGQQVQEQKLQLQEKPPQTPPAQDSSAREVLRDAARNETAPVSPVDPLRAAMPVAYAVLMAAALLLAGLFLAHAALVPLVIDLRAGTPTGPARAWAVVASRIGALLRTALLGAPLVALGFLCLVVPGIALAVGFSFAIPAALTEKLAGRAALQRSWTLMRRQWPPVLGMWALIAIFTLLGSGAATQVPPGPWRSVVSGVVHLVSYPLPLVGMVLLYVRARQREGATVPLNTFVESPRPGSSA
jgi:hypothetical protein